MLPGGPAKTKRKKVSGGFKPSAVGRAYAAPKYSKPKPAPYRPTPKQVSSARAQERAYESQGKAVKKVAHVQKAQGIGRPTGGRTLVTRKEYAGKVKRAKRRAREDKAIKKLVGFDPGERYRYTPKASKTNVMPRPKGLEDLTEKQYQRAKQRGVLATAGFVTPGTAEAIVSSPKHAIKAISNIPKDVGELAVGIPTSTAHTVFTAQKGIAESVKQGSPKPAIKAGEEIGKGVIEPYKQLAKDPLKFATEHPVTTALMVKGPVRGAKLGAGKTARVTGAQTLKRTPATLPGTTLKTQRVGSRSAPERAVQGQIDKAKGPARIRDREIRRMVDEDFDLAQQHRQAAEASKTRKLGKELGQLTLKERGRRVSPKRATRRQHREEVKARREGGLGPLSTRVRVRQAPRRISPKKSVRQSHAQQKAELAEKIQHEVSGAAGGARATSARRFAERYGSHWYVDEKSGALVKPKNAPENSGRIYATRAEAERVRDSVKASKETTWEPVIKSIEGETEGVTGGFAVMPKVAAERMRWHHGVGQSVAPGATVLRVGNRQFRKAVLPVSPKWLTGQGVEAGIRAAAMGAGPTSLLRYRRVMRELRKVDPAAARELEMRAISGGQFGETGPIAAYTAGKGKTMAEEFKDAGPALAKAGRAVTRAGQVPVVGGRLPRKLYGRYTRFVFNDVNGAIERLAKKAMLGKAIKQGPLMERSLVDVSGKAAREAAQGLRETSNQIEAARQTVRAYGKYSQMSPAARETILHTTPFIPWMLNMGRFLGGVMPRDHPVKTSLAAAMNQGDQEWRESKGLSYYGKERKPDWLMGSYPAGDNKYVPVGRFGPFAPGDIVGALGGQVAPQYTGALMNLAGVDWKGREIKGGQGAHALNALISQAEAMIPGVGVAGRATGLSDVARLQKKKQPKPSIVRGDKTIKQSVLDTLNPFKPIEMAPEKKKAKPKSFGGSGIGSGFGASGLK